jgi:dTDP-4-dehydrorhamnose reductase
VDKAQSDIENADLVNRKAVKKLSIVAKELNIKLIHISTDYVFDGKNFKPYVEEFQTNPQSVYGKTKLDGENELLDINPLNSIIIRTSWVYSYYGNNFVKTMLRLGHEKEEIGAKYMTFIPIDTDMKSHMKEAYDKVFEKEKRYHQTLIGIHRDDILFELMTHDKKNDSNEINFTLLSDIGEIHINQTASKEEIYECFDFFGGC